MAQHPEQLEQELFDVQDEFKTKASRIENSDQLNMSAKKAQINELASEYEPQQDKLLDGIETSAQAYESKLNEDAYGLSDGSTSDQITYDQAVIKFKSMSSEALASAVESASSQATLKAIGRAARSKGAYKVEEAVYNKADESLKNRIAELNQYSMKHGSRRSKKKKHGDNFRYNKNRIPKPKFAMK